MNCMTVHFLSDYTNYTHLFSVKFPIKIAWFLRVASSNYSARASLRGEARGPFYELGSNVIPTPTKFDK